MNTTQLTDTTDASPRHRWLRRLLDALLLLLLGWGSAAAVRDDLMVDECYYPDYYPMANGWYYPGYPLW